MSSSVEREEEGRGATDFFKMGLGRLRDCKKNEEGRKRRQIEHEKGKLNPLTNPYLRLRIQTVCTVQSSPHSLKNSNKKKTVIKKLSSLDFNSMGQQEIRSLKLFLIA